MKLLSLLSLKFANREYEEKYQDFSKKLIYSQMRTGILLGIVIYCSFLPIDYYAFPGIFDILLWNRLVIAAVSLFVFVLLVKNFLIHKINEIMLLLFVAVTLGTIHLGYSSSVYYPAVISPLLFFNLLVRGRFLTHAVASLFLFLLFLAVYFTTISPLDLSTMIKPALYFSAVLVALVGAYFKELSNRHEFWQYQEILNLANYDELTGLPLMRLARDRFQMAMHHAKRRKTKVAILFLDLDEFKKINDTYGHEKGDTLLRVTAERLAKIIRSEDTIARIGGDEFLVILNDIEEPGLVFNLGRSIISELSQPVTSDNISMTIGVSIGVSIFPDDADAFDDLKRLADLAMYKVKNSGKNNLVFASDNSAGSRVL